MTNYSKLSNKELYIQYQQAKTNFRNAIEGTTEEIESDRIFTELSNEVENRQDFDWLTYKLEEQQNKTTTVTENIENYTYILTNETPETFTKCIEKADFKSIKFKAITLNDINEIINMMNIESFKYCYDIQQDRFYEVLDLIEML